MQSFGKICSPGPAIIARPSPSFSIAKLVEFPCLTVGVTRDIVILSIVSIVNRINIVRIIKGICKATYNWLMGFIKQLIQ